MSDRFDRRVVQGSYLRALEAFYAEIREIVQASAPDRLITHAELKKITDRARERINLQ